MEPKRAISRSESRDPAAAVSTNKLYIGSIGDLQEDELRIVFINLYHIARKPKHAQYFIKALWSIG